MSVPVRAGGMSLHHGRTLHGSPHNMSSRQRRVLFLQYTALDAFPCVAGLSQLARTTAAPLPLLPLFAVRSRSGGGLT